MSLFCTNARTSPSFGRIPGSTPIDLLQGSDDLPSHASKARTGRDSGASCRPLALRRIEPLGRSNPSLHCTPRAAKVDLSWVPSRIAAAESRRAHADDTLGAPKSAPQRPNEGQDHRQAHEPSAHASKRTLHRRPLRTLGVLCPKSVLLELRTLFSADFGVICPQGLPHKLSERTAGGVNQFLNTCCRIGLPHRPGRELRNS